MLLKSQRVCEVTHSTKNGNNEMKTIFLWWSRPKKTLKRSAHSLTFLHYSSQKTFCFKITMDPLKETFLRAMTPRKSLQRSWKLVANNRFSRYFLFIRNKFSIFIYDLCCEQFKCVPMCSKSFRIQHICSKTREISFLSTSSFNVHQSINYYLAWVNCT